MTLPSQSPRSSSPLSSGARNAKGMRSLFVAVAALGLGGAAAGWFLTHKSESPEPLAGGTNTADTIADPLNASAAGNAAAGNVADESVGMLPAGVPGSTLAAVPSKDCPSIDGAARPTAGSVAGSATTPASAGNCGSGSPDTVTSACSCTASLALSPPSELTTNATMPAITTSAATAPTT